MNHTCIKVPESTTDKKYPNMLNMTKDMEEEYGLYRRGTIETTIPEQAGSVAPPKNKTSQI